MKRSKCNEEEKPEVRKKFGENRIPLHSCITVTYKHTTTKMGSGGGMGTRTSVGVYMCIDVPDDTHSQFQNDKIVQWRCVCVCAFNRSTHL